MQWHKRTNAYHPIPLQVNEDGVVNPSQIDELQCDGNTEADTMIIRYAGRASQDAYQVLGRADDADVFILLFHHTHRLCDIIMEFGVRGRNNRRWIDISELVRII